MVISIVDQTVTFGAAFALGAALCLLYDLFRILRTASEPTDSGAFVQDVLFFAVCGFVTYCLMLARCDGKIRGYAVAGEIVGFIACRVTVSRLIMMAAKPVVSAGKRLLNGVKSKILHPIRSKIIKIAKKIAVLAQNVQKKIKNLLKLLIKLVYNDPKQKRRRKNDKTEKTE